MAFPSLSQRHSKDLMVGISAEKNKGGHQVFACLSPLSLSFQALLFDDPINGGIPMNEKRHYYFPVQFKYLLTSLDRSLEESHNA